MAAALNRPAVLLDLSAFVLVSVFCISTAAPIMQQDIFERCQDALRLHRIPTRGLSVDGRDVLLSGARQSPITSNRARTTVEAINGVRVVTIRVSHTPDVRQTAPEKVGRLLSGDGIAFKTGTSALTADSESALDKVAAYLAAASNLQCEIRSFDGQSAEIQQDRMLAFERALAVENYLELKGIAHARLSTNTLHAGEDGEGQTSDSPAELIVRIRN